MIVLNNFWWVSCEDQATAEVSLLWFVILRIVPFFGEKSSSAVFNAKWWEKQHRTMTQIKFQGLTNLSCSGLYTQGEGAQSVCPMT